MRRSHATASLLLLWCTGCDAYAAAFLAPHPRAPVLSSRPAAVARTAAAVAEASAAADEPVPPAATSPLGKVKAWFGKWAKFDKAQLQTLGVDAFFTYGVVSNLNVAVTASLAWCIHLNLCPLLWLLMC